MAVITWPSTLVPGLGSGFGQARFDLSFASDTTGASQSRVLGPPRWTLTILQPELLTIDTAGQWQAVLLQLRGRVNHLAAWDFGRPQPRGTMRGTLTLGSTAVLGATSLSITGGAGQASTTLKAGDRLQLGTGLGTSQTVMVLADATANGSGVINVTVEPPLRQQFSSGAAVTWDKPLAYFRQRGGASSWTYAEGAPATVAGISLDLIEAFN